MDDIVGFVGSGIARVGGSIACWFRTEEGTVRRLMATLAGIGLLAMAPACGSPSSQPSVEEVATPSASPTRSATEWNTLVRAAKLEPAEVGAASFKDEDFSAVFVLACAVTPSATRRAARAWSYVNSDGAFVSYAVGAYDPQPGTAVVDQARTAITSCADWTTPEQLKMTVGGEFPVDRPPGADAALAFCYTLTYLSGPVVGQSIVVCQSVVSRGPLVALIGTYDKTREPALARLATLVPLAATGLQRALP